jgi:hypothetical protein
MVRRWNRSSARAISKRTPRCFMCCSWHRRRPGKRQAGSASAALCNGSGRSFLSAPCSCHLLAFQCHPVAFEPTRARGGEFPGAASLPPHISQHGKQRCRIGLQQSTSWKCAQAHCCQCPLCPLSAIVHDTQSRIGLELYCGLSLIFISRPIAYRIIQAAPACAVRVGQVPAVRVKRNLHCHLMCARSGPGNDPEVIAVPRGCEKSVRCRPFPTSGHAPGGGERRYTAI